LYIALEKKSSALKIIRCGPWPKEGWYKICVIYIFVY